MAATQFKNFSYLKGPKGDKGDKGDIGLRGPKGDKGDTGPRGPVGAGASLTDVRGAISATSPITYNQSNGIIGFNSAGFATENYVNTAVANLVNSAPDVLNTLGELSNALGNNPDLISTLVLKSGSTMTGFLTLSGNPTSALHAATKQYVDSAISALPSTTDDIVEGSTNLFFTEQRARDSISVAGAGSYDNSTGVITITGGVTSVNTQSGNVVLSTGDVAESTNLYYTTARANTDFDTRLATKSTTNLAEGTNLYFTDARARSAISVGGSLSYNSGTGIISYTTPTTDGISEGSSNLYYTTARANTDFDARLATKSTTNLTEGTNLYYTTARANTDFDTRLATKSTSDVEEGTNLYYTDSRARLAISVSGDLNYDSSTGVISFTNPAGFSGNYNDLINKPVLATVATSGSYNDLTNRPVLVNLTIDGGTF